MAAYHKLFSGDSTPLEQQQAMLKRKRSVLDTVLEDAKTVGNGLSKTDNRKLSEYLQSVRDIETRLAKEEQWMDVPKKHPADPVKPPSGEIEGYEEVIDHGRHLVMEESTPLCNLWLSLLRGVGLEVDSHGDSTGIIDELFV